MSKKPIDNKPVQAPFPGSNEAINMGCICPVFDNNHGKGVFGMQDQFWINQDCPIHGKPTGISD